MHIVGFLLSEPRGQHDVYHSHTLVPVSEWLGKLE